jgi:PHD/YefM family antitoxin component YafN of YafNO toxin-antitoxin module
MKRITITEQTSDLNQAFKLAEEEPVLILAPNGKQYVLAPLDEFEQEVEALRQSEAFHHFLDQRSSKNRPRRRLSELADETNEEIAREEAKE